MNSEAQNMKAIVEAKEHHNRPGGCPFQPHTVVMAPFEIDRMGWEVGDTIAGLTLDADPALGTGEFRLLCDRNNPPELDEEIVVDATADDLVVAR